MTKSGSNRMTHFSTKWDIKTHTYLKNNITIVYQQLIRGQLHDSSHQDFGDINIEISVGKSCLERLEMHNNNILM